MWVLAHVYQPVVAAMGLLVGGQSSSFPEGVANLQAVKGTNLTVKAAADLERRVTTQPNDREARVELLGYYFARSMQAESAKAARTKHILWLIRHQPEDPILGTPFAEIIAGLDPEGYRLAKNAWMKQLESHPSSAAVLGSAAAYLQSDDPSKAIGLLKRAEVADPKAAQWPMKLGHLYSLRQSASAGKFDLKFARLSYTEYERTLKLSKGIERSLVLEYVAKAAYDATVYGKAKEYAGELLKTADRGFPTGVDGNAIHHGNLILGRLALRDSNVADAKKYLLAAGKTLGSPQLDSFGPNMSLAKELLEKGEREVVIEYFALCAMFWKRAELDEWASDVKAGRLPDFGANLVY